MNSSYVCKTTGGLWRGLLVASIVCITVAIPAAAVLALDREVIVEAEEDDPEVQANLNPNANWMTDENFNQWVFSADGGGRGSPAQARSRLTELAKSEIGLLERLCGLNKEQKLKLELASRGDIIRLFDRVESAREQLKKVRRMPGNVQEFWGGIQKLQIEVNSDKLGPSSMFRKTLLRALTSEQKVKYLTTERTRRQRRNRARVANAIVYLETIVPLVSSQRKQLTELIEKEIVNAGDAGRYETYVMLYRIGKIPKAKLKPVFDPVQLPIIERKLAEYGQIGQWLTQQGLLRDEPPEEEEAPKSQLSGK